MSGHRSVAVVIPARLESRRFPRKILARDTGKFLVEHVWDAVQRCDGVARVVVATDSDEVAAAVRSFGGDVRMTSRDHVSGTDRVAEVARELREEIIVNVQGDEPLIEPRDIELLIELFGDAGRDTGGRDDVGEPALRGRTDMTTLVVRRTDAEGFRDPNIVKAAFAADGRALYFSRAPIPHLREADDDPQPLWWQHLGLYGYRREVLAEITRLEPTELERRERLEQLRALENGYVIRIAETGGQHGVQHIGVDTPEDYRRFVEKYAARRERSGV